MAEKDCIFCRIVAGELPADTCYSDDRVMAFRDINPLAPVHILVVPRQHVASLNETRPEQQDLLGHLLLVAANLAREQGVAASGYRLVTNCGPDGGQVVQHLHFHLLGGRPLGGKLG